MAKDRIISVVDPEARHAHKSRAPLRDGYKAHIVGEPETGLFTNAAITKADGAGSGNAEAGITLLVMDPSTPATADDSTADEDLAPDPEGDARPTEDEDFQVLGILPTAPGTCLKPWKLPGAKHW